MAADDGEMRCSVDIFEDRIESTVDALRMTIDNDVVRVENMRDKSVDPVVMVADRPWREYTMQAILENWAAVSGFVNPQGRQG
jgi:hypothetical protein